MELSDNRQRLDDLARKMNDNYEQIELLNALGKDKLPDRDRIVEIIKAIRRLMFPGYFGQNDFTKSTSHYFAGEMLSSVIEELKKQVVIALRYHNDSDEGVEEIKNRAEEICYKFAEKLPEIQRILLTDVQAGVDGDPASSSAEEIIFSYPGFNAIFIYRIAHELYLLNVPFIPRVMTEYGHSRTGVDINPGATIGEYFFIDHGTGVVIGETTEIGRNVKVYQGVTLGALSTRKGRLLTGVKRHPTIRDNVTIYSNASILGGDTVIGANSTIGGNAFITESVPPNTRVSIKNMELTFIGDSSEAGSGESGLWDWVI
ncbi:MAG: serine acetyltransferase [Clostridiales bacterium]|nr:serine acetyltransferase [Clostridiales bacterium]